MLMLEIKILNCAIFKILLHVSITVCLVVIEFSVICLLRTYKCISVSNILMFTILHSLKIPSFIYNVKIVTDIVRKYLRLFILKHNKSSDWEKIFNQWNAFLCDSCGISISISISISGYIAEKYIYIFLQLPS